MKVLQLFQYQCRETISILKVLLSLAMQGKLRGLAVFYRTEDGVEESIMTGYYKTHAGKAAESTLRMSLRLMRANGEID